MPNPADGEGARSAEGPSEPPAEPVGSAELPIASSDLAVLLTGKSLPVTNGYAPNRVHAGVDFGSTGDGVTAVSAPVNGTIVANTSACGKVAIFDGSNTVILAHMTARTTLGVGSPVSVGTYLGKASQVVGGGCIATGPHLHLEIRKGNHPVMADPAADNTATTLDPLGYTYGPFPAVSLVAPAAGALVTSNPVTFSWSPIQGASVYRLQLSQQNSFDGNTCTGIGGCLLNTTTGTTQLQVNLPAGTYYWRVRAGSSYAGGAFSAPRLVKK
ncbi:MAG: M23 family metallopeptidase [Minicystis sp.]